MLCPMANILIAENDTSLNSLLTSHLSKSGYACRSCFSVQKALSILQKQNFDLVVIDRILDDGDGLEIASYLHDLNASTRVLFLSDIGDTKNRILGLENGADDYMPKPFSFAELSLKIGKLISSSKNISDQLTINDLKLDINNCSIKLDTGKQAFFRKKEAEILATLIRHQNQVVSREQIISTVWGSIENVPSYVTIDAYIRKIRMKIKGSRTKIITHRGIGYRMV